MASRVSIKNRAKAWERKIQQYLWEGSSFAGHAKRPALEDQDVCGLDSVGNLWWGEVKNRSVAYVNQIGTWTILNKAFEQCEEAIKRNKVNATPFAVLCPSNSTILSPKVLVMLELQDNGRTQKCLIPLKTFKERFIQQWN